MRVLKTGRKGLVGKLDRVFSLYIRLRDVMPSGYVKCISCGQIKRFEDVDCGHFYSRRHMATRFDEDNCNAECKGCNRFSSDHIIAYQRNLVKKIGEERFELLGVKAHTKCHFLDLELKDKILYYQKKARLLAREKGINVKV